MKISFVCLIALMVTLVPVFAQSGQKIKVALDFESAQLITNLLSGNQVTEAQLDAAAKAHGNQQLIVKVKGYSGAGEDVFKATLREVIETGTIKGEDKYNWKLVKSKLPEIKKLLVQIAANQESFITDVTNIIQSYTAPQITATVRACFLVGGGSLGFVNGGDNTFNVALQKVGNDYEGLKYLVAHELYHSMQDAGQKLRKKVKDKSMPYFAQASYGLAYNVWNEGTANLVGDFANVKTSGMLTIMQRDEEKKNNNRRRENFLLLESMIYKAYNDTASRTFDRMYNIAFSTSYDEAGYFMGYEMAKKIEQYSGRKAIADMLVQDPLVFFEEYIRVYKAHPEDQVMIRFDASTEQIIAKLAPWKDKI
ncbi:DUF5700 domain-containing putative Zn-dependent protease [Mucilaginibacter glaciei]|uniref:DUF2268 domain-containing protein n=1 Tax=Mucilaginibacter glaciei TaxID=2772109 RepID=A0A926NXR4_9SPHI|nr:DUF5700 domain-containing putative Zn-dependent protease [Mucilaginibacter glaciei]MBD1393778.1 hypothetical protein [Mucilaginibacter glaciei]